jgi:hypothetical protein
MFVAKAGLKLAILLPQPPECWDYRSAPPHVALKNDILYYVANIIKMSFFES